MSNGKAIAAVTASLRALLSAKLHDPLATDPNVTTFSPDKAHDDTGDRVNLFLYHTQVEPSWRNTDLPRQNKPGETGHPPLPLNLYYLLTAFSNDKDEVHSHRLLGLAMSVLHDHPLLDPSQIKDVIENDPNLTDLRDSDLHEQIERVRITLQPLSVEEISKLWTAFQTQFRTSVSYQISVVLIESQRPAKTPLPVLQRGKGDTGVSSQADVTAPIPPFPGLLSIDLPPGQTSARLGDVITLNGYHLDGAPVAVRLSNPNLTAPPPVTIKDQKPGSIQIQLDDVPANWVAGFYTVAVDIGTGADLQTTNELPLAIAPIIVKQPPAFPLPLDVTRNADQSADVDLKTSPQVQPRQRAALLLGDREVFAEPHPAATDTLTFKIPNAPLGDRFLRLRVDGVDSLLVLYPPDKPPVFDPDQKVTIHD
jgi:Pvc16 N-terminal domain